MATATSERRRRARARSYWAALLLVALLAVVFAVAGRHVTSPHASAARLAAHGRGVPVAFAWLRPEPAPASGWRVARLPSGVAELPYPVDWRTITTDPGSFSAARVRRSGEIVSYLNATPQSGTETLADWTRFRPAHLAEEGARDVHLLASATGLRFRSGRGSCVIDAYSTSVTSYREIACLVSGARASTVVVGAAQPAVWATQGPVLERAISGFTT